MMKDYPGRARRKNHGLSVEFYRQFFQFIPALIDVHQFLFQDFQPVIRRFNLRRVIAGIE